MTQAATKPLGLVLTTIYSALSGLLSLMAGTALLLAGGMLGIPAWVPLLALVLLTVGVLLLACVYGLWSLQPWGRTLTILLYGISIPISIAAIFPIWPGQDEMTVGNTILQLTSVAIDLAVILYLRRSDVTSFFTRPPAAA